MAMRGFKPGDWVVYRKQKHSRAPGRRATNVYAAPQGEDYTYEVAKYWVVVESRPDRRVVVKTRRGKVQVVVEDDPNLRRARWWERLLYRRRFPRLPAAAPPGAVSA